PDLKTAFLNLHFPEGDIDISLLNEFKTPYHQRLAFDEFLFLQAGLLSLKMGRRRERGISFRNDNALIRKLAKALPFKLTNAQRRVVGEILRDMESPEPMNRLIQGDVGSGKTVVALMAMLKAVGSGYQAALMAPTEILAEQHYNNIKRYLEGLGVTAALLTGSSKNRPYEGIKNGEIKIIVGTHALIQEGVEFGNLGLVVIDEQHRFGVLQRAGLRKKGQNPDVLVMTATPIPRTMALTLYGDLEYSLIDELPPGRKPVRTMLFLESEKKRIYEIIHSEIKKGHQAYIVYPAIEESEKLNLRSAVPAREALEKIFPRYRIGLIHGRMKQEERDQIMKAFKEGDIDILVSTTVVEVGVDVPNATVMLVVHAERFGLSQLHQLRGRVGRGEDQAWCLLLAYGRLTDEAVRRLEVMVKYSDGFRIAEEDFKIRGPGELFGTRQSGLPDFRVADLFRDAPLLQRARSEAERLIEDDPLLSGYPLLRAEVERFWKGKMEIFRTS
ncbi:MAG: ATP-dependent DNA helicase RecG, partial [Nitrospirae bacterium]